MLEGQWVKEGGRPPGGKKVQPSPDARPVGVKRKTAALGQYLGGEWQSPSSEGQDADWIRVATLRACSEQNLEAFQGILTALPSTPWGRRLKGVASASEVNGAEGGAPHDGLVCLTVCNVNNKL